MRRGRLLSRLVTVVALVVWSLLMISCAGVVLMSAADSVNAGEPIDDAAWLVGATVALAAGGVVWLAMPAVIWLIRRHTRRVHS